MNRGLSFRHAAALVGEKHPAYKALDSLLGGALITGTAGGSEVAAGLFDVKGEFIARATELGNTIVQSVQGLDRLERTERVEAANSVLLIVSFFETLALLNDREYFVDEEVEAADHRDWARVSSDVSDVIARTIRRRVRSAYQEQDRMAGDVRSSAARRAARRQYRTEAPTLPKDKVHQILVATSLQPRDNRLASVAHVLLEADLPAPAPHLPYEAHLQEVRALYAELASSYAEASLGMDWDTLERQEQVNYKNALSTWTSDRATTRYQGNFQKLAALSPEVAFWANAIEHQATRHQIEQLRLGLDGLRDGLESPSARGVGRAASSLALAYKAALRGPVVATNDLLVPGMQVPELHDIYINPEFRALGATASSKLELESTWQTTTRRSDIQSFLIGYLSTPASTAVPLLILGQPGSGKSVLTKMLAASLPEGEYLPVRVVLREIPADDDVQGQIEAAVFSDTGERVGWTELVEDSGGVVPVLLFDGFDELLQSTGVTQSDYLERISKFQARERSLGRPCVAVVTSRTAVADRARIPHPGVTAVRIEPFSESQVERWTAVWNLTNATFFASSSVRPLAPSAVLAQQELASQPLLLLMLALYDANGNALQSLTTGEARSSLYERLLSAFARRELDKTHAGANENDLKRLVESHIHELSVAALAMFNRSRQWVLVRELDDDLHGMRVLPLQASRADGFRRAYSVGEALIGKFFFVHEARAIVGEQTLGTVEFLHATFGEYLVARVVSRELVHLVSQESFSRQATRRSAISDDYLAALLSYAGLSSRATILEFLRELLGDVWRTDGLVLRDVLHRFFRQSLDGGLARGYQDYRPVPISQLTAAANYSFNLLAILLLEGRRIDASDLFGNAADENDAWTRHALFLRSQLAREAWVWLTEYVDCVRSVSDSTRATTLQLRDPNSSSSSSPNTDATPSDWHHGLEGLGDGSVAEIDDHARAVRSNHLTSDADSDLALRCVQPIALEIGEMYTIALIGPTGVRVTGAEALVRLWLASSKRGNDAQLAAAYDDCITLAMVGRGAGGDNFRDLLIRQLAKDLTRLPGQWREEMRKAIEGNMSHGDEVGTWSALMVQSLGFRGRSSRDGGV